LGERLKDKVAVVTGAGSIGPGWGNGKATAVLFAREGAKVFAVDVNPEAAEETKAIIDKEGGECTVHQADVSKSEDVRKMVERCIDVYHRIDILHNNVGILEFGGPVEASEGSWDRVISVNLTSQFLTCKYVIPHMIEQGGGVIINISSMGGIRYSGNPEISYHASKAGIIGLTQDIAGQYGEKNIRAVVIIPGAMDTPMGQSLLKMRTPPFTKEEIEKMRKAGAERIPLRRSGDAWDVAYAALFLASDEAKYITGTELVVDGGMTCKI
jgi:NAD(P)-dependent dehydrogenase (short-subunit alcohol dehydrogenase family)